MSTAIRTATTTTPELESAEKLVGDLDSLLQEGVILPLDVKARIIELLERALDTVTEIAHIS